MKKFSTLHTLTAILFTATLFAQTPATGVNSPFSGNSAPGVDSSSSGNFSSLLEPSVTISFAGKPSEELTAEELFIIATEFSLCPINSPEGEAMLLKYRELENAVKSEKFMALEEPARAEQILFFLHDNMFTKYEEGTANLKVTFDTGVYNCVTSSIMYLCLARAAGLTVEGQKTNDHALCSVYINGRKIDVETTNRYGYEPGVRKIVGRTENSHRYTVVPRRNYAGRREISRRSFATLTGKNIVSEMNEHNEYNTAIPLAAARFEFLKNENAFVRDESRNEFDVVVTNYANSLVIKNDTKNAMNFLETAEARHGSSPKLADMYYNAMYNAIVTDLNNNNYESAKTLYDTKSEKLTERQSQQIKRNLDRYYEIQVHNRFATAVNSRNYDLADQILTEGLNALPNSTALRNDRNSLNRILRSLAQ